MAFGSVLPPKSAARATSTRFQETTTMISHTKKEEILAISLFFVKIAKVYSENFFRNRSSRKFIPRNEKNDIIRKRPRGLVKFISPFLEFEVFPPRKFLPAKHSSFKEAPELIQLFRKLLNIPSVKF